MSIEQVNSELYLIPLSGVNAYLIDDEELTLIDTGIPGSTDEIIEAIQTIGRQSSDLKHILVTHCHPDHAGSLAELKRRTGAAAYMHHVDAAVVRTGRLPKQDLKPTPGLEEMFHRFIGSGPAEYEGAEMEHEVHDGERMQLADGMTAIHAPGHCAGQLAFLWDQHGGVLFAADAASNMMGLGYHLGYQDFEEGQRTLSKLAKLNFNTACFGHGEPITRNASAQFMEKWGS